MRSGRIRRPSSMHEGKSAILPVLHERLQRWVHPEVTIQIERTEILSRPGNSDGRAGRIIFGITVWHDHIQSIYSAAQKHHYQLVAAGLVVAVAERPTLNSGKQEGKCTKTRCLQKFSPFHFILPNTS